MKKTLTVIGPNGTEVTILKPRSGSVCVITKAGMLMNLSDEFAKHLASDDTVQIARIVKSK